MRPPRFLAFLLACTGLFLSANVYPHDESKTIQVTAGTNTSETFYCHDVGDIHTINIQAQDGWSVADSDIKPPGNPLWEKVSKTEYHLVNDIGFTEIQVTIEGTLTKSGPPGGGGEPPKFDIGAIAKYFMITFQEPQCEYIGKDKHVTVQVAVENAYGDALSGNMSWSSDPSLGTFAPAVSLVSAGAATTDLHATAADPGTKAKITADGTDIPIGDPTQTKAAGFKESDEKTVISVDLPTFTYLRPTSSDSDHPTTVYTPTVTKSDNLYFHFQIRINPNSGLTDVKCTKVKVSLLDGQSVLASEEYTYSTPQYPTATIATGTNIDPLTIPDNVNDLSTYTLRIDAFLTAGGHNLEFQGVDTKSVQTHFQAVEVARTISGEDNESDASRLEVKSAILNRWNFPGIENGHAFTRSELRKGNATIYDMALDDNIFEAREPPDVPLNNTVQHARQLGSDILANPNAATGNGPIYFYSKTSSWALCDDADDPEVNLLYNCHTYGNKYFSPTSDPNNWTTQTVKTGYDADPNDCLIWQ